MIIPGLKTSKEFIRSKRVERKYHQQAKATIVQDEDRAKVLLKDNHIKKNDAILIPVSLLGESNSSKTDYLHRMLGIPKNNRIILSLGMMAPWRLTNEMIISAQSFPETWVLVVHGSCESVKYNGQLENLNQNNRAIISTKNVPVSDLNDLVSSADIGLVFYSNNNENDLLAGKSSYKVAQYAKAGVPMIANNYPSFRKVFDKYECGRCIGSMDEMRPEIEKIFDDYDRYQAGAIKAYEEVYEFSKHFNPFVSWLSDL